jgi:pimeloyl-ACP methyl ester carboxylesterase
MKRLFLIFAMFGLLACAANVSAQSYLNLAQKRTNVVSELRMLGPLSPPSWTATYPLLAVNYDYAYNNPTYQYVGNYGYAYLGPDPNHSGDYIYDYIYKNTGNWTIGIDSSLNNTSLTMTYLGIVLPYLPGNYSVNYSFGLNSSWYNVAGLKYQSVFIINSSDGTYLYGWIVNAGQTVTTTLPFSTAQTFDVGQNVETPSFAIADYWYGSFFNYPQSTILPSPQNTTKQSQNALFVGPVSQYSTNVCWVQEGVYRPGLTLEPGYSSPLVYTYMQQYFDSAWKADPTTGTVPRTSTANWNGVNKINTNSAVRTGVLSGLGYYYVPTQFGKSVLITQPQENGYYGEVPFYALQMLVDQNRDGILNSNDVTTASSPHVFWMNNDCDRSTYSSDDDWDEQDIQTNASTVTDAQFVISKFRIPSLRDLEDYDRLQIRGLNELCRDLPTGQGYSVVLRWKTILSGSPGIFVLKSADTNGGSTYLTDPTTAAAQIYPTLYPTNATEPGVSPLAIGRVEVGLSPVLDNDSVRGTNDFFIYCGTSRGSGELAVSVYKGSTLVGETSVFLDIRDVKELYERWTLGDGNGGTPATTPTLANDGLPTGVSATQFSDSTSSGQNYILFVHGWNMSPFDKDAFAETAFKRLYWQGYTNRFGSLRWPTTYGFDESAEEIIFDAHNYDNGEYVAWHSAEGLRQHLVNLNSRYPGKVYMVAHSMGNVVAGEALALNAEKYGGGQIVNTYVASQAAVPLDCYDPSAYPGYSLNFQFTPHWLGGGSSINYDSGTFNVYSGWLSTNKASCGTRVNFYNTNDWALSPDFWQFDETSKPDNWIATGYKYVHFGNSLLASLFGSSSGSAPTYIIPSPARKGLSPPLFRQEPGIFVYTTGPFELNYYDFEYNLNDMYEVMAYASEARTYPLGRSGETGVLERRLDLSLIWLGDSDPDPNWGIYGRRKWHSGEFNFNYMTQSVYWRNLVGQAGFFIFSDR